MGGRGNIFLYNSPTTNTRPVPLFGKNQIETNVTKTFENVEREINDEAIDE